MQIFEATVKRLSNVRFDAECSPKDIHTLNIFSFNFTYDYKK